MSEDGIRSDSIQKAIIVTNAARSETEFSFREQMNRECGIIPPSKSAIISACGTYRYRLEREISDAQWAVAFLMINPSTADAEHDDPTIRKVKGFATRFGAGRVIVGNQFAFRATDIKELRTAREPIGPDNDRHLEQIMRDADMHVVAWGALAKLPETLRKRWQDIVRIADRVGCELQCIGTNQDGHPTHPVLTGYDVPLTKWAAPWFAGRSKPNSVSESEKR